MLRPFDFTQDRLTRHERTFSNLRALMPFALSPSTNQPFVLSSVEGCGWFAQDRLVEGRAASL